jgi:hypothetical protein
VAKDRKLSVLISARSGVFAESLRAYLLTLGNIQARINPFEANSPLGIPSNIVCDLWLIDADALMSDSPDPPSAIKHRIGVMRKNMSGCRVALIANSREQKKALRELNPDAVLMKGMLEKDLAALCARVGNAV